MNNLILLDPTIIERDGPVPPIIWNIENDIRYEDIKLDRYEETIDFLCRNYFPYEVLSRSVRLSADPVALQLMCDRMRFLLRDECSMAAIDVKTDEIIGVAILKIMRADDLSWSFWRLLIPMECEPVAKIMGFQCELIKYSTGLKEKFRGATDLTLNFFAVAVARERKGTLLKEALLLNACKIARSVGAQAVTYICTSRNDKERSRRVGFEQIDQKIYSSYTDKQGTKLFCNLGPGEYSADLFGCLIGPRAATSVGEYMMR